MIEFATSPMTEPAPGRLPPESAGRQGAVTRLVVDVVSGDAHPVAWADVEAHYEYRTGAAATSQVRADGDGRAVLVTTHTEPPASVAVTVAGQRSDGHPVTPDMRVTVEL